MMGDMFRSTLSVQGVRMLRGTVLLLVGLCGGFAHATDEIVIERAVLTLIEHADVPAPEAGRLDKLVVTEGDVVTKGQPVAQIEDREIRLTQKRAVLELESAQFLASDLSKIALARKSSEKQRQMERESAIDLEAATKESSNDVPVRATEKAMEVAQNQYQRGVRSREAFKNSISDAELDGLKLSMEKATLEHEQAEFDLSVLKMKLVGKEAGLKTQQLAVEVADLEIRAAESQQHIAQLQANLKKQDVEIAAANVERRNVTSPLDGVVVEQYREAGEWVEPGEKILRIIRMNRLRAEGFIALADVPNCPPGANARVEVTNVDGGTVARDGKVTFVSPEVDPVNHEVRLWVEFDNPEPALRPGMRAKVRLAAGVKGPATTAQKTGGKNR
jgi:multidrug efflux pump subunit AcrA (membrane-fusion protein)